MKVPAPRGLLPKCTRVAGGWGVCVAAHGFVLPGKAQGRRCQEAR